MVYRVFFQSFRRRRRTSLNFKIGLSPKIRNIYKKKQNKTKTNPRGDANVERKKNNNESLIHCNIFSTCRIGFHLVSIYINFVSSDGKAYNQSMVSFASDGESYNRSMFSFANDG